MHLLIAGIQNAMRYTKRSHASNRKHKGLYKIFRSNDLSTQVISIFSKLNMRVRGARNLLSFILSGDPSGGGGRWRNRFPDHCA